MTATEVVKMPEPKLSNQCNLSRKAKPLPQSLIEPARRTTIEVFDSKRHVSFQPPEKIYTMEELGFGNAGISPNAISAPFPLFTEEAVQQMRAELFSQTVLDACQVASGSASNMIRGHCPK